jgi:hypothetical protein
MKRGPKPVTRLTKETRGTLQPCRDAFKGEVIAPGDPPMAPEYLSPEAQIVWMEEIGRVMIGGVGERDSSLFARYCATEALARKAFLSGEPPPAAYLTELRRMAELLGIAGPRVRQGVKPGGAPISNENPFARNGRRAA